jgi:hypothetical protein
MENKIIKKYLDTVKKLIKNLPNKKEIILEIQGHIEDKINIYSTDINQDERVFQVLEEFGSPEIVARGYIENYQEYLNYKKNKKKRIFIIVSLLIICIVSILFFYKPKQNNIVYNKLKITTNNKTDFWFTQSFDKTIEIYINYMCNLKNTKIKKILTK